MLNGRLFGLIWRECDMEKAKLLQLVIDYLDFSYGEFYEYLEQHKEIEGTEAEVIIANLEKAYAEESENGTTKSN